MTAHWRKAFASAALVTALCITGQAFAQPGEERGASAALAEPPKIYTKVVKTEGYNPIALAISGGISLGSYEAGVNWALIRYYKRLEASAAEGTFLPPRLMAVTGASAGGINALITGLSWCVDPAKAQGTEFADSVNGNLFKDIWFEVGFHSLLPEKAKGGYLDDDGLLTRDAFKGALDKLERAMGANIYTENCSVPIGLMVTRTKPHRMPVNGITVENERFIIPLQLSVDDSGKARFKPELVNTEVAGLGNVIYPAGTRERDADGIPYLARQTVIDAVLASSAFPVAFGRKELRYCLKKSGTGPGASSENDHLCPPGFRYDSADFVDGGVFDNIPLGAAKALAEPHEFDKRSREAWENSGRRFSYMYIDPDHRRYDASRKEPEDAGYSGHSSGSKRRKTYGLRSQAGFLSGAISTGRTYELYKTMGSGDWSRQAPQFILSQVIPAIDKAAEREGGGLAPDSRESSLQSECDALYSGLQADPARTASVGELLLGRRCLRDEALSLSNSYLFDSPLGESRRSNDEVATLRKDLLRHAQLLVRRIDPQLDLFLQKMARDRLGDRTVILTSRFFPITGHYLAAFGAFIDKPFREFDYYAGVYDAVNNLADFSCEGPTSIAEMADGTVWGDDQKEACIARRSRAIYLDLGIHEDSRADTVFHFLSRREKRKHVDWKWLDEFPVQDENRNLLAIGKSLEKTESADRGR